MSMTTKKEIVVASIFAAATISLIAGGTYWLATSAEADAKAHGEVLNKAMASCQNDKFSVTQDTDGKYAFKCNAAAPKAG